MKNVKLIVGVPSLVVLLVGTVLFYSNKSKVEASVEPVPVQVTVTEEFIPEETVVVEAEEEVLSPREEKVQNAELGGTDYNKFAIVESESTCLYSDKNGEVIATLPRDTDVYVHIVYDDGWCYSGMFQGYIKWADLRECGEVTERMIEESNEVAKESTVKTPSTHLSIPSASIDVDVVVCAGNQANTDKYDVIQYNNQTFNTRLIGHNTRTLKSLKNVSVGDEITYSGITYEVTFSGSGIVSDDKYNVISDETGDSLLYTTDLEIVTCHGASKAGRWVVLANLKSE